MYVENWRTKPKALPIVKEELIEKYRNQLQNGNILLNRHTASQPIEFIDSDGQVRYNKRKLNELTYLLSLMAQKEYAMYFPEGEKLFFDYEFLRAKFKHTSTFHDLYELLKPFTEVKLQMLIGNIFKNEICEVADDFRILLMTLSLIADVSQIEVSHLDEPYLDCITIVDRDSVRMMMSALNIALNEVKNLTNYEFFLISKHTCRLTSLRKDIRFERQTTDLAGPGWLKVDCLQIPLIVLCERDSDYFECWNYKLDALVERIQMSTKLEDIIISKHLTELVLPMVIVKLIDGTIHFYASYHLRNEQRYTLVNLGYTTVGPDLNLISLVDFNLLCTFRYQNDPSKDNPKLEFFNYRERRCDLAIIDLRQICITEFIEQKMEKMELRTNNRSNKRRFTEFPNYSHLDDILFKVLISFDIPFDGSITRIIHRHTFPARYSATKQYSSAAQVIPETLIVEDWQRESIHRNWSATNCLFFVATTAESLYVIRECGIRPSLTYCRIPGHFDLVAAHENNPHAIYTTKGGTVEVYRYCCIDYKNSDKISYYAYELYAKIEISYNPITVIRPVGEKVSLFFCATQDGIIQAYDVSHYRHALKEFPSLPKTSCIVQRLLVTNQTAVTVDERGSEITSWGFAEDCKIKSQNQLSSFLIDFSIITLTTEELEPMSYVLLVNEASHAQVYLLNKLSDAPVFQMELRTNIARTYSAKNAFYLLCQNDFAYYLPATSFSAIEIQLNLSCQKLFGALLTVEATEYFVVLADDSQTIAAWCPSKYIRIDLTITPSTDLVVKVHGQNDQLVLWLADQSLALLKVKVNETVCTLSKLGLASLYNGKKDHIAMYTTTSGCTNKFCVKIYDIKTDAYLDYTIVLEDECQHLCLNDDGNYLLTVIKPHILNLYRIADNKQLAKFYVHHHISAMAVNNDYVVMTLNNRQLFTLMIVDPDNLLQQEKLQSLPSRTTTKVDKNYPKPLTNIIAEYTAGFGIYCDERPELSGIEPRPTLACRFVKKVKNGKSWSNVRMQSHEDLFKVALVSSTEYFTNQYIHGIRADDDMDVESSSSDEADVDDILDKIINSYKESNNSERENRTEQLEIQPSNTDTNKSTERQKQRPTNTDVISMKQSDNEPVVQNTDSETLFILQRGVASKQVQKTNQNNQHLPTIAPRRSQSRNKEPQKTVGVQNSSISQSEDLMIVTYCQFVHNDKNTSGTISDQKAFTSFQRPRDESTFQYIIPIKNKKRD
ncbi:unnamed protein product [Didymodactylos carnosus]|uniref:Uncharacterized protein n=1 Tax=Didymodactylos carnosus TaxID=1234261 RepID=A0A815A2P4_9BILA|nr:unnamed protein product [Didymodactylos carnosus]CAF4024412.1 unnamed protein product [Didymodactylos carnosus]